MNDIARSSVTQLAPHVGVSPRQQLTAADIRHRVNVIQEVMNAVMKKDVHYGIIPGCDKPTLYKPGSEILLATFQIAPSIEVEDLSTDDCIRYRVRVIGTHGPSGIVLGEGIGECSSNEGKYKWRKAYDDEFNATPENRRRVTFGKYKNKQVRTDPADMANTILKMAKKRAQVDMTLTVTGASDCFDQDIEDLPDEYRQAPSGEQAGEQVRPEKPAYPQAEFDKNLPIWRDLIKSGQKDTEKLIAMLSSKATFTDEQLKKIRAPFQEAAAAPADDAGADATVQDADPIDWSQNLKDAEVQP